VIVVANLIGILRFVDEAEKIMASDERSNSAMTKKKTLDGPIAFCVTKTKKSHFPILLLTFFVPLGQTENARNIEYEKKVGLLPRDHEQLLIWSP
jgi:hypothetical protein